MLETYIHKVDAALKSFLNDYNAPSELYEPLRYVIDGGGKRVRPVLTLLACEAVGGNSGQALHAASAVELMHVFTLMHDDIMDSSEMRRGRPTVHVKWNANTAILTGDVTIGIALRLLESDALRCNEPMKVMSAFSKGLVDVCEGQSLDMSNQLRTDINVDQYFETIDKKTAKLLEMSVEIGARLGKANEEQVQHLRAFANNIGLAFQLQDDLLDIIGGEQFGKTAGGDITEGKMTWFVIQAIGRRQQAKAVVEFLAHRGLPQSRHQEMIDVMESAGIFTEAKQIIENYTNVAYSHLETFPQNAGVQGLRTLAATLMERQR